jgi:hypothetical protein
MNQTARHSSNEDSNMKRDSTKIHRDDRMIGNIEQMECWRRQGEEGDKETKKETGRRTVTEERNGKENRRQEGARCGQITLKAGA